MNEAVATQDRPPGVAKSVPWRLLSVASLVGVVLVLLGTHRYGVGVSPDSTGYLCAARSLLVGQGYRSLCYTPYTAWPPLFPTVLAGIGLIGIEPAVGARFLNALAMGGIIFVSGIFFSTCLRSRWLAAFGTCSVVLSFPLLSISSMAWTEPLFVLLIVSFALPMAAFLRGGRTGTLVAAAVLAALCALQRYTGVAVIGAGAILILWPGPHGDFRRRLKQCVGFTAIASIPLGLWMIRNHRLTGMLSGYVRQHSIYSIRENLATTADTITRWFVPGGLSLPMRAGVLGALIVLGVVAILLLRMKAGYRLTIDKGWVRTAGLVTTIYLPLMLYTHQVGVLAETMNDRYLAPLAVLGLWLIGAAVDEFVALVRRNARFGRAMASALVISCGAWLGHPLRCTYAMLSDQMNIGAGGYSRADWQESPLAKWLHSHPLEGVIRSNAPDALYALTGVDAHVSPHRTWDIPAFRRMVSSNGGETLVWFGATPRSYLYDLDELVSLVPVEEIVTLSDGGVYRLGTQVADASFSDRVLSTHVVAGARHRRFTSDAYGPSGVIASWVLREDGTTESEWQLAMADGSVVAWSASGPYSRSGDRFEFRCEGQATRTPDASPAAYRLHVRGTICGDVAAGEYRIEFSGEQGPSADQGSWRVDVARPVYRLYSRTRKIHAYAMSREEVNRLLDKISESWVSECLAFCVYPEGSQPPDALPVFRFSSEATGADFYTISETERAQILGTPNVWEYRGVAWYAYSPENRPDGTKPVHRFWCDALSTHFYTMDEAEKDKLLSGSAGPWAYEGIVWYAVPAEAP